jgi:hypothetical protein
MKLVECCDCKKKFYAVNHNSKKIFTFVLDFINFKKENNDGKREKGKRKKTGKTRFKRNIDRET